MCTLSQQKNPEVSRSDFELALSSQRDSTPRFLILHHDTVAAISLWIAGIRTLSSLQRFQQIMIAIGSAQRSSRVLSVLQASSQLAMTTIPANFAASPHD
jgi:hypothetical protein